MKATLYDSARKMVKATTANCPCRTMHPAQSGVGQLHKAVGNREVQRLYKAGKLQAALKVGRSDDVYEREADRVVEQVMRMPESLVQKKCRCSSGGQPCAKCAEENEKPSIARITDVWPGDAMPMFRVMSMWLLTQKTSHAHAHTQTKADEGMI